MCMVHIGWSPDRDFLGSELGITVVRSVRGRREESCAEQHTCCGGEWCTDKVRRRCWTYDAGATGWQKSWREAKAAKGQRQKQDAALKTAALHLNLTPRANGYGATNDRTATTGAALPSIFAGRSMLRPYEAAPRVRDAERGDSEMRRQDVARESVGTPFDYGQNEPGAAKGQRQKQDAALKTAALHLNLKQDGGVGGAALR